MSNSFRRWGGLVAAVGIMAGLALTTSAAAQSQTIQLFNGKDLTNFYTWLVGTKYEDPNRVFSVVDAVEGGAPAIRVSGQ
jgi:hypothetical protein